MLRMNIELEIPSRFFKPEFLEYPKKGLGITGDQIKPFINDQYLDELSKIGYYPLTCNCNYICTLKDDIVHLRSNVI